MTDQKNDKKLCWEGKFLRALTVDGWEYVERVGTSGIVVIVPVTSEGNLVLVEQYRPPVGLNVVELPAGLAGDIPGQAEESMKCAAERELLEETGYKAGKLVKLFEGVVSSGLSTEYMTVFHATKLTKIGKGGGDADENITVHEVPLRDLTSWLDKRRASGTIVDLKIYSVLGFIDV